MNDRERAEIENLFNENIAKLVNKGIIMGQEHSTPSPETLKLINKVEIDMNDNKKDIGYIKETVGEIKETLTNLPKKFADKKETEKKIDRLSVVVFWAITTSVVGVIGTLVNIIFFLMNK